VLFVIPGAPQTNNKQLDKETKLKQKIVEWGTNKNVAVKLKSGEKIDGRIAEIKDDLFTVQLVAKDKVTARELHYGDVDKISEKNGGKAGKIAGYTVLGVLAGVGVMFLIVLGVWARN
jgi:translation initiation factor IF-1